MLKNLPFYLFVTLICCVLTLIFLPYSLLTNGVFNLSSNDISKINRLSEREFYTPLQEQSLPQAKLVKLDWESVDALFKNGDKANAIDVKSGLKFCVLRIGGSLHADIRPASDDDKIVLSGLAQCEDSSRAILIEVAPSLWAGASLCGRAFEDSDGAEHFCLYFYGSKAHSTRQTDAWQDKAIATAYKNGKELIKN